MEWTSVLIDKMQLFLLILLSGACFGEKTEVQLDFTDSKVFDLKGQEDLDALTGESHVTALYFYKRVVKNFDFFVNDYKLAAESLDKYDVSVGFCDCTAEVNKELEPCTISKIENSIHTYRDGKWQMHFSLRSLFSVDFIVGNILQLVMLNDVPLLRNETEVGSYLSYQEGKQDLVLAYFPSVSSSEHRAFLEVAYANKDKFQFAITLDKKSTKLMGDGKKIAKVSTIWWVWTSDGSFTNVKYGGQISIPDLTKYINTLNKPKKFDIPGDGTDHPFSSFEVPIVKLYYNAATKDKVYEEADVLIRYFGGGIGILVINMDSEKAKAEYKVEEELPTLSYQRNDQEKEEFLPSDFNTPSILNYISVKLNAKPTNEVVDEGTEEESDKIEDPPFNLEEVARQDDAVADAVHVTRKIELPLSLVPALTAKTFQKFVKDSEIAVVMFYFHFDALSDGNIRMFGEAADRLGKQTTLKLARVSCYDWTDICQEEKDLTIFPTLRVYKKGKMAWDYKGPQDTQAFYSILKLLELSSPVYETDKAKLMEYIDRKKESILNGVTNTTVVGLFKKGDKKEKEVFEEFSRSSRERILFAYTDIKEASDIAKKYGASLPAVILFKSDDKIQPFVKFVGKVTTKNLQEFVDNNKLPKLTVLTPLLFPEIRQRFSELLILFTDGKDKSRKVEDTVREIVKAQKFKNISMNLMDVPNEVSVGFRVLELYMPNREVPHISLVRFQKGEVFNFESGDVDTASLSDWLSNIQKGSVEPSSTLFEEDWKPRNKGFEFLEIIEWQKRNPEQVPFKPDDAPVDAVGDRELGNDEEDEEGPDETEHTKGPHHVFHRSSHALHTPKMKKGDHSEEDMRNTDEVTEHESQQKSSSDKKDKNHKHTEL